MISSPMPPERDASRPLHVGLNLVFWQADSGGVGSYARELIRSIREVEPDTRLTAWLGTGAPPETRTADWAQGVDWVRLPLKSAGSPVHMGYELALLGLDARRRGVDVVHGLAYATPVLAPGVATVVSLHDLTWRHFPETVTPLARRMFGLLTPLCGKTANRVIAVSQDAKDDLVRTLGLPADKIDVVLHGSRPEPLAEPVPAPDLRARLGLPERAPVVLAVGQIAGHKNLGVLIDALGALPDAHLVLAGRRTPHSEQLGEQARRAGLAERVHLPGYVDDAALEGLYALADVVALPSLAEGFGLPVIEAMRRGVPVACSDRTALPEVAGGAALLFDPRDAAGVAGAVGRLLSDRVLRDELVERGRRRADGLTWEGTARETLAVYRRALGCTSA